VWPAKRLSNFVIIDVVSLCCADSTPVSEVGKFAEAYPQGCVRDGFVYGS
jgi:hypothetical protein